MCVWGCRCVRVCATKSSCSFFLVFLGPCVKESVLRVTLLNIDPSNKKQLTYCPIIYHPCYSHFSWPMTLNKQLPRTMVWASLPVQLSNTSIQLVWRESVTQLSTTPLNSFKQGKSWQSPCIEIRHVEKKCEEVRRKRLSRSRLRGKKNARNLRDTEF